MGEDFPQTPPEEPVKDQIETILDRVGKIANILREMGYHVLDQMISREVFEDSASENGVPIVSDGGDGVRVSYKRNSGKLLVWFTNGFSDPNNPDRKAIIARLKTEGLM